jgi:two-component system, NarL family, sensor kinase
MRFLKKRSHNLLRNFHDAKKKWLAVALAALFVVVAIFLGLGLPWSGRLAPDEVGQAGDGRQEKLAASVFQLIHSNPSGARERAWQLLDSAGSRSPFLEAELLKHIGSSYLIEEVFAEALKYYTEALAKANASGNISQMADINNNIGVANRRIGNFKKALVHFHEALAYDEYLGNEKKMANTLGNVGLLYLNLENAEKAKSFSRRALDIFSAAGDSTGMASAYNNLSSIYSTAGDYGTALEYLSRAIALSEANHNHYNLCISHQSVGKIQLARRQPEDAIRSYTTSLELAEKINQSYHSIAAQLGIAQALLMQEATAPALDITLQAMEQARELNSLSLIIECHQTFSQIYRKLGDYHQSLLHYEQFVEARERLVNQNVIHQLYDFELDILNRANQLQQLELESKELAISKRNALLVFTILVFVLILGGLYLLYLNYSKDQRVKLQQTIIRLTEKKSHAAVEAEIQERKRIGQELHDGLGQLLSVAGLHISVLQQKKEMPESRRLELLDAAMQSVDEAFMEVRNISHNLAPSLLSERGLEGALKNLADQVNQSKKLHMEFETFGLNGKLNSLVENTLFRAIQEILNNTIKHSSASALHIQIAQGTHEITLMAEDNGSGFEMEKVRQSPGHGLTQMKSRIENLNGSIHVDSSPARGTIISIVIPLNPGHHVQRTHKSFSG